jgi:hypothetical protein
VRRTLLLAILLAACGGESTPSDCSAVTPSSVPSDKSGLFAFLDCGGYESFAKESAPHDSTGPHGGMVQVYINGALMQSLMQGATEHPVGAAAIKELLSSGGSLEGWAAMVKVEAGTDPSSWYWYENFSTEKNTPAAEGRGISLCNGCHSMGPDRFRTPFPLQ